MDKTSYRVLTLTAGCMLLLSITAQRVIAWPCPPCPDCYRCTPTGCECQAQCGCGGRTCSDCCVCSGCSCVPDNSKCDQANCYACDGCSCVYQCDPDLEICCDGSCEPKCEDGEPTGQCDTSYNEECIGCTVFPYTCSDFRMREYTGNEVRYCTGGCPGDCVQQNAVECYVEYECKKGSKQVMTACGIAPDPNLVLCGADIEGGGGGVACVPLPLECALWYCSPCVKNNDRWQIEYAYPRKCQ